MYLPGTTVELDISRGADQFLDSVFATGGLVLSQVLQLTGLQIHTVQNWVKRKFVSRPVAKRYDENQFCTIVIINMLGELFQIEQVRQMIESIEAVQTGAPSFIYRAFVDALARLPEDVIGNAAQMEEIIEQVLKERNAQDKLFAGMKKVLLIMLLAYISLQMRSRADLILRGIMD